MKSDLVSVILPVWKPKINLLKTCIDSILNQTYSNLELIIVFKESGKNDNDFYSLLNEYSDSRIKVLKADIKGISNQRNQGIQNSDGEFIASIDADDFCLPERLEKELLFKKQNQCNIVGSWAHLISETGEKIFDVEPAVTHTELKKRILLKTPILHSSALMDKKMLDEIGYYDTNFKFAVDYELWLRAMSKGYKFGNVPEHLITLRVNTQSVSRGSTWREQRRYVIKAKTRAIFHYGFFSARNFLYYLLIPLDLLIPPSTAMNARKFLKRVQFNDEKFNS